MPTYEYLCDNCGHEIEKFQSISARVLRKCPACGRKQLKRLIGTGAGIIFKGSGFYQTDYRSSEYKSKAKAEKESAANSSESKPKKDSAAQTKEKSSSGGEKKS